MQMDSRLILAGKSPQVTNSFAQGAQTGQYVNDAQHQNALRSMMQEQGPGIRQGDPNALNALAQFDPQAALGVDNTRGQIEDRKARLGMAREASKRQAAQMAVNMSAAEREAESAKLERALAMGTQAQTPEQWDQIMTDLGAEDYVGQFENRDVLVAGVLGIKDGLEMAQGPEPMSPEGKFEADRRRGLVPEDATRGDDSAKSQQIERLVATGLDRNTAIGIADGRLAISRDPITGVAQVIDKATGQIIGGDGAQPADGAQQAPQDAQEGAAIDDEVPRDFAGSTGIPGLARSIANAAASAAGQDLPAPEVENAVNTMNALNRDTMTALSSSITGRPSNFSMQQVQQFLPEATGVFQGPERTLSRARETRRAVERDINAMEQVASGEGGFRPNQVSEARQRLLRLRDIAQGWDTIIDSLDQAVGPRGGEAQQPADISVERIREMSPQQRNRMIGEIGVQNLPDEVLDYLIEQGGQ